MNHHRHSLSNILLIIISILTGFHVQAVAEGDRQIPMNIVYPPGAFKENGRVIIDFSKPHYNAKGDGITDNSRAFISAMNFLRDELNSACHRSKNRPGGRHSWSLYLPNGTYLVSDSLVHEGTVKDGFCFLRLIGQDRPQPKLFHPSACRIRSEENPDEIVPLHFSKPIRMFTSFTL
ncbi:MAG: hypothetical protein H8M99_10265 [Gloeobacteraceae cyanobacterium ES-bin-144]|nr:hypothetical protein [Verrucomicrobiales bacterium]